MYHPIWKASITCCLCLIFLCPSIVRAQIPSPLPHTYVNDFAHVLTLEELQVLNEQINALEKVYSVQLAVVLVKRLPDSMDIADFARAIGRKWHASINDSGLVYVASISQKKQRLEVSTGLEGIITDITARSITDHLKPFFRNKDYAGGLKQMVSEIDGYLKQVQAGKEQVVQPPAQQAPAPFQNIDNNGQSSPWPLFVFVPFGLLVFFIILRNIFFGGIRRRPQYYSGTGVYVDNNVYVAGSNYGQSYSGSDNNNNIVDSGSSGNSDYGNWGGGSDSSSSSSDPGFSSSDSGFSGGGTSNDW